MERPTAKDFDKGDIISTYDAINKRDELIKALENYIDYLELNQVKKLNIDDVSERFLVEYKNDSGACRQKYIDAINKDDAWNKFKITNGSEITSITNIRQL
jgi:hypothetical protein